MITEVSTKYQQNFVQWLNSEAEMQKLGLSEVFNWQWFITMTSKDTMTKNGARLAMTRFLGLYLQETKTSEVQCFWVAEPHNQGKNGYHIHAILETKWPMPKEKAKEFNLALMLDDIYQRAMGITVIPIGNDGKSHYLDKWGRDTMKHRFRAEVYTNERGSYCAKYITKGAALWEFARVTQDEVQVTAQDELWKEDPKTSDEVDCKGNWNKKTARLRTREQIKALSIRKGEKIISLRQLLGEADYNYAKFSKLRTTPGSLEITMNFEPKPGIKIYA